MRSTAFAGLNGHLTYAFEMDSIGRLRLCEDELFLRNQELMELKGRLQSTQDLLLDKDLEIRKLMVDLDASNEMLASFMAELVDMQSLWNFAEHERDEERESKISAMKLLEVEVTAKERLEDALKLMEDRLKMKEMELERILRALYDDKEDAMGKSPLKVSVEIEKHSEI